MEKNNFTLKPISEFNNDDTLYIQKIISGYLITFFVNFIKYEKGMITGRIIEIQPNNYKGIYIKDTYYSIGDEIPGRISKCYTYKKDGGCHWFQKNGSDWSCKDK
jgi:hypothetical protein